MILELKPEQEAILEEAMRSGRSREEVLDEVFAHIRAVHEMNLWVEENLEEIQAQIEEGFAEAERGELVDAEDVVRILREDRAQRKSA